MYIYIMLRQNDKDIYIYIYICARIRGFQFHSGQLSSWNWKNFAQNKYYLSRQIPVHIHD